MNQETIQNFIKYINDNVTKEFSKNFGITFTIFFIVIVSQIFIAGVVDTIDSIPLFNSLMELIGVYVFTKFIFNHMLTKAKRDEVFNKVKTSYQEIVGAVEQSNNKAEQ